MSRAHPFVVAVLALVAITVLVMSNASLRERNLELSEAASRLQVADLKLKAAAQELEAGDAELKIEAEKLLQALNECRGAL